MFLNNKLFLVVIIAALATIVEAAPPEKPISMLKTKSTFSSASNIPALNLPNLEIAQLRSSAFSNKKNVVAWLLALASISIIR